MKKWLVVFVFIISLIGLASCEKKPVKVKDVTPPRLIGVTNVIINEGDTFDPLAGVSATDDVDGTITNKIVVSGTYDVNVPGVYTLTYTVTDVAGNKTELERTLTVRPSEDEGNQIINGDFKTSFEGNWTFWTGEGGSATLEMVNEEAVVDVAEIGSQFWSIQFNQGNLSIEQGKMYLLSLDIRASVERDIIVKLEDVNNVGYIDDAVTIGTTMQTYEFEFFVTKESITNGKLVLGLGNLGSRGTGLPAKIYFDNVSLVTIQPGPDTTPPMIIGAEDKTIAINSPFNPLDGVKVTDNRDISLTVNDITVTGTVDVTKAGQYALTYKVKDASGNETTVTRVITVIEGTVPSSWLVVNGDFEDDQLVPLPQPAATGWGWHGAGRFTAEIKNGVAKIDITNLGNISYGIQFYQQNRVITQGQKYKITFKAKADIARPIMVALEEGISRRFDEIVHITTEWATYTVYIDHFMTGYENGKFAFFMGDIGDNSVPTTVYLDDIVVQTVEEIPNNKAPQLYGVADFIILKGTNFDPLAGVTVVDDLDEDLLASDITVEGTVDTQTVGVYTLTYKIKDSGNNEAVYQRKITVVEKEDMPENSFVIINGNFDTEQLAPVPQPATTGWGWHGAGTFTIEIKEGIATIVVTEIGTVPHGVQFYLQNRVIVGGATYKLTFRAKALDLTPMRISLEAGTDVRFFKVVDITKDWVDYEVIITPSGGGFANGKFGFFMGKVTDDSVPTTFYIDNVNVELIGTREDKDAPMIFTNPLSIDLGSEFNPLEGVEIFDLVDKTLKLTDLVVTGDVDTNVAGEYTITYTLVDSSGNETSVNRLITVLEGLLPSTWEVVNGDFETEQLVATPQPATTGWGWHGAGTFTIEIKDGMATIDVTKLGTVPHGVQFYQQNRVITKNQIYKLTFKAKADIARPIMVALEEGTTRRYDEIVQLTTEWVTYELYIVHSGATFTNGKFAFFAGLVGDNSVPTKIYIDDVVVESMETLVDNVKPQIFGLKELNIKKDSPFNALAGLTVRDDQDKTLTVEDIEVIGSFDTSVLGKQTVTLKIKDASGNENVYERVIYVVEESELPENTFELLNGDFSTDQTEASDTLWKWQKSGDPAVAGEFTANITGGIATIDVTKLGTVPHGVQFNQFNREIVAGSVYLLKFKVKASNETDIRISLEAGTEVRDFRIVTITDEWVEYEVVLIPAGGSFKNGKLGFFLGKATENSVPAKFEFEYISVELIGVIK